MSHKSRTQARKSQGGKRRSRGMGLRKSKNANRTRRSNRGSRRQRNERIKRSQSRSQHSGVTQSFF
jgi:hypothetical protein